MDQDTQKSDGKSSPPVYSVGEHPGTDRRLTDSSTATPATGYRTYKRRWFGLVQLVLMNIVVSWCVSSILCLSLSHISPSLLFSFKHILT